MTPKEKAIELVEKYIDLQDENLKECDYRFSKLCALIAIDEIINLDFNIKCDASERCVSYIITFYENVKIEIEKL